jgi:hypothetical protein
MWGFTAAFGEVSPELTALMYLFGIMFFFGFPITLVVEIAQWARRRRKRIVAVPFAPPVIRTAPAAPVSELKAKYCSECGTVITPIGATGKSFCSKCNKIYD